MRFFTQLSASFLLLFSFAAEAILVSYQCTLSDLRSGSAPCTCPINILTPPFCPRLEGIKIPCVVKVSAGTCTYENGQEPAKTCLVGKSCDVISTGGCKAPLEDYNCDYQTNGACLATETYDCSTTSQGACNNFDEAGNCLGYATIVTPQSCQRCTSYETITVQRTCQKCTAGYEQITTHYEKNEGMCGCETYSP